MFNLISNFYDSLRNNKPMTLNEFLEREIKAWLQSQKRNLMITGSEYYEGIQDIDNKTRTAVDSSGTERVVRYASNNKIKDNRYSKLVDQKVSFLLSRPLEVHTKDSDYKEELNKIFNKSFMKKLKNVGTDSLNGGIAYLHPYIQNNELHFKRFTPESILPFWRDEEHEDLESFLRIYTVAGYEGTTPKTTYNVEYYTKSGISYFELDDSMKLKPIADEETPYIKNGDESYNWEKVPLIAFKYNAREIPLIARVKTLQDALNNLMSTFADSLEENIHNTVLVIDNYDGTNLSEFRKNLIAYGAIKVRTVDGIKGDVRTLSIDINAENYKTILRLLRNAITDNGRGFDAKDDRFSSNPNEMNIRSMYADIDLDASFMESEFQASLEQLLFFVNAFLSFKHIKPETVDFVFNHDLPQHEEQIINACRNSVGILSMETIVKNHPWTTDTEGELKRLKEEEKENMIPYEIGEHDHESVRP